MTQPLQPVITAAGLQSIFNHSHTGLSGELTHIGLGSLGYVPDRTMTQLQDEQQRISIVRGQSVTLQQIHLEALVQGDLEYWIREVGFYLADGTLLALWSEPDQPLAYKAKGTDIILTFDLALDALPENSVQLVPSELNLDLTLIEHLINQVRHHTHNSTFHLHTWQRQLTQQLNETNQL